MSKNQCDGCARNLPLKGGIHYENENPISHPVQYCMKALYVQEKCAICTGKCYCGDNDSFYGDD